MPLPPHAPLQPPLSASKPYEGAAADVFTCGVLLYRLLVCTSRTQTESQSTASEVARLMKRPSCQRKRRTPPLSLLPVVTPSNGLLSAQYSLAGYDHLHSVRNLVLGLRAPAASLTL